MKVCCLPGKDLIRGLQMTPMTSNSDSLIHLQHESCRTPAILICPQQQHERNLGRWTIPHPTLLIPAVPASLALHTKSNSGLAFAALCSAAAGEPCPESPTQGQRTTRLCGSRPFTQLPKAKDAPVERGRCPLHQGPNNRSEETRPVL